MYLGDEYSVRGVGFLGSRGLILFGRRCPDSKLTGGY
jgi:hypothetical protein